MYNAASVETNADLITNAVILFFINDIDERVMSALKILAPDWTEIRMDEIKRNLLIRSGAYDSDNQEIEYDGSPHPIRSKAKRSLRS